MKPKSILRSFLAMASSTLLTITYVSAGTYYWDSNGDGTAGFGTAAGTWRETPDATTNKWSTSPTGDGVGGAAVADYVTNTSDDLFFGTSFNLTSAATTISDATVTCGSTANLKVGMTVTGTGIPASTTVASITDSTTFELSANATATNTGLTLSATFPFTGAVTISGTVNANRIYQSAAAANFLGTSPTINFSAQGTYETPGGKSFPASTTITGAATSLRWISNGNLNITNVTANSAGSTILSTSSEATSPMPGRVVMNAAVNLGATNAPLVFDGGTVRMLAGFPYTSLSTLNTAHTVTFTLNKDAGFDNSMNGPSFTVDMPVNLGTGKFWPEKAGSGATAPIILTSTSNTWSEIRLSSGILEIDDQNKLGLTVSLTPAPLRFGSGAGDASNGTLRIMGTTMTSFGARQMLTTIDKGVAFEIVDAGNTFTVDQLLNQGTGGFTKSGAGSLIIKTTSSYTGTTTVSGGTLSYGTALGIAPGAETVNGAGAVLAYGAHNPSVGTVTLTNGSVTGSGTLTSSTAFVCNPTSPNVFPVGIKLGGTLGLTKTGTGTTTVSADNSGLSGPVTINGGILNINSTTALGTGAVTLTSGTIDATSGPITLSTNNPVTLGGNFAFTGTNTLNFGTGAVTNSGNRTITLTASGLTLGGDMTNTSNAVQTTTVNGVGFTLALGGGYALSDNGTSRINVITGTGNVTITGAVTNGGTATTSGLTKTGTGTLTLNGNNTYDGLTTHSTAGSTLTLAGDNSDAAGGLTLNNATAVLNVNHVAALGTGTVTLTAGTINNTSGSAKILTTNNPVTFGSFTFGGANNLTFGSGAITNNGNLTITLNGTASTLAFGGVMTNVISGAQATTVNGAGNTLSLGGYALSNSATFRTCTVQGSGNVTINGAVSGSSSVGNETIASVLIKSGTGTLTLQGINTFAGATTVNTGGCLALVGGSQNSAITVNSGAFLGFTLGQPTTSTKGVILAAGHKVRIAGTPTAGVSYTLLTTSATIFNSPDIETPLATHTLVVEGNNTLVLKSLSTPFQDWAAIKGLDGTAGKENGKTDDPDGDGKNNNFEFAFNGNPLNGSDNGMIAGLVQDARVPAGNELTLVVAVRDGATFSNAGSPVVQTATIDGVTYTIQGSLDLVTFPGSAVSHATGPSNTAPVATGLPSLSGTAWEYHTFKLDASEGLGSKGFLRAKAE